MTLPWRLSLRSERLTSGPPGCCRPRHLCRGPAGGKQGPSRQVQQRPRPCLLPPWGPPCLDGPASRDQAHHPREGCSCLTDLKPPPTPDSPHARCHWCGGTFLRHSGSLGGRTERTQAMWRGTFEPGFATHCGMALGRFLSKSEPLLSCAYNTDNKGVPPMASAGGLSKLPHWSWAHTAGDATSRGLS